MADFPTQVRTNPRTGREEQEPLEAAAAREAEAWRLAQLATTLLTGSDLNAIDSDEIDIAVAAAKLILVKARRQAAS